LIKLKLFFQQWFFIKDGNQIYGILGNSGNSSAREDHGRYGHAFALYQKNTGVKIPTVSFRLNGQNELHLENQWDDFRVISWELYGNYKALRSETSLLFFGMYLDLVRDGDRFVITEAYEEDDETSV
jgi:hypothetical protein